MTPRSMSLLEVVIAGGVLTTVLLFVGGATVSSVNAANFDMASTTISSNLHRSLDEITRELRDAGGDEFDNDYVTTHPYATTAAITLPSVTFRRRIGLDAVAATDALNNWSAPITYQLADGVGEDSSNGVDDDGDGLVDERRLTRTQNGLTTTLSDDVVAFRVTRDPTTLEADELQVSLTLARGYVSGGRRSFLARTETVRVVLRNRPRAE